MTAGKLACRQSPIHHELTHLSCTTHAHTRRMLLDDVVAGFDACITAAPELRRSVIHGDANETNLLVDAADGRAARVTGLLDFGDCTHSILASEVAIATVYMLLLVESKLGVDTSWRAAAMLWPPGTELGAGAVLCCSHARECCIFVGYTAGWVALAAEALGYD